MVHMCDKQHLLMWTCHSPNIAQSTSRSLHTSQISHYTARTPFFFTSHHFTESITSITFGIAHHSPLSLLFLLSLPLLPPSFPVFTSSFSHTYDIPTTQQPPPHRNQEQPYSYRRCPAALSCPRPPYTQRAVSSCTYFVHPLGRSFTSTLFFRYRCAIPPHP